MSTQDDLLAYEMALLEFENAWREQEPPSLGAYAKAHLDSVSFLLELSKIDIEHRLSRGFECTAESYGKILEQLNSDDLFKELLEWEFELRCLYRSTLSHLELNRRFAGRYEELKAIVSRQHDPLSSNPQTNSQVPIDAPIETQIVPGMEIYHYRIDRLIGSGAFAIVYLAEDVNLVRKVAIKFLKSSTERDQRARDRIVREAQAVAMLNHENIVAVYETGQYRGHDYVVSRYAEGASLEQVMDNSPPDIQRSVEIALQLARGLSHAHSRGVVHRDLKPANIAMEGGKPVILDFGFARLDGHDSHVTHAGEIIGTPAFMPPEQADGRAWQADPRSDIYSLGAILYRMVCGCLPFEGTVAEVLSQVAHVNPESLRRRNRLINRDLDTIVLKCLEKEPFDRYQRADELAIDLERFLRGAPILARPVSPMIRVLKWARRNPVLATLTVLVLVGGTFLIGMASQLNTVRQQRDLATSATLQSQTVQAQLQALLAVEEANAGRLAMQRGHHQAALDYFERSLATEGPHSNVVRLQLIEALVATHQLDSAQRTLELLQSSQADRPGQYASSQDLGETFLWQAELLHLQGNSAEAVDALSRALEHPLKTDSLHYAKAMMADSSPEALDELGMTLDLNPFHHRARRVMIALLISLARFDDAAQEIRTAKELFPEDADFLLFDALNRSAMGNIELAVDLLKSAQVELKHELPIWLDFCKLVDFVANRLVIAPGIEAYDKAKVQNAVSDFSRKYRPLMVRRGWILPPKLVPQLSLSLARILDDPGGDQLIKDHFDEETQRFEELIALHPEGTLCVLSANRILACYNDSGELPVEQQIDMLEKTVHAFERCVPLPAFSQNTQDLRNLGTMGGTLMLALGFQRNRDENLERFGAIARLLNPDKIDEAATIRIMTIGLLEAKEFEAAIPWADRWIELTSETEFDAAWHRLMADHFLERWYDVLVRANRLSRHYPDHPGLKGLLDTARQNVSAEVSKETISDIP